MQTIGSSTDRWNYDQYLTPAIVNSESFGGNVGYKNFPPIPGTTTISVDYLPMKITYAEPISVEAKNEGDAPAPAVIKVKGPLEKFYVLNQTTGEYMNYSGKVESGREIWFDTQNVTATEHGTGITEPFSRFAELGFPADWIRLAPGTNKILVAGLGGTAATELIVEYRSAWE